MNLCEHPDHLCAHGAPARRCWEVDCDGGEQAEAIVGLGGTGRRVVWLCAHHWEEAMASLGDWLRGLRAKLAELN